MEEHYRDPVLAEIYDDVEGDRADLPAHLALAGPGDGRRAIDLGCGTGTLALLLAARGWRVTGVDPAAESVRVARSKPGAEAVEWVVGDSGALPGRRADLVLMTGNAAQAVVDPAAWTGLLGDVRQALVPGGRFVFETRDPRARAWETWADDGEVVVETTAHGPVAVRTSVPSVEPPVVTYRTDYRFLRDGGLRTSTARLRFRTRAEVEADLRDAGFAVRAVGDAPDRPGLELVFTAVAP